MIQASAPARAGVIGNPTDGYGGSLISCTLGCRANVRLRSAKRLELAFGEKETAIRDEKALRLDGGVFDIAKSVIRYLRIADKRFRLEGTSEIPLRSGLAGSTAMLAAVFSSVCKFLGKKMSRYECAETIRYIELNYMDIQCGYQDQYMTVFGGLNYIDFRTKEVYRDLSEEAYATVETLADFVDELPFVVVHTGVQRISGSVLRPVRERWLDGDPVVVEGYREIGELARQGKKALIRKDWEGLGALMNRNHEIQQELGASGEVNDRYIELARKSGALGAKLAGAGGGGTIIALHHNPEKLIEVFRKEGNPRIMFLDPQPGLTIEETS